MDATGETHIPDSGQQSLEPKVGCPEEQYVIILRRVQKDGGVRTLGGVCELLCPRRALRARAPPSPPASHARQR